MKLEINQILDRGDQQQERLWIKVLNDTDLSFYIVFDTTYTSESTISNIQRHAHWFRPRKVKAGDSVILYTRPGQFSTSQNPDGSTNHFLFWGLGRSVWNEEGDCAVLFEVNSWSTRR
jgi:hypothetical protein